MKKALWQTSAIYCADKTIYGDASGLSGNVSGIRGNIDECELTAEDRAAGGNILDLLITAEQAGREQEAPAICKHCGGAIEVRNPTGKCDHLYWPENLTVEARRANGLR